MRRPIFDGIIISHLGNINGPEPERENTFSYIQAARKAGWHVCMRVIFRYGKFLLPHANGYDVIQPAFLARQHYWSCALSPETVDALCEINAHCFLAAAEHPTLTSAQFVWTPPPHYLTPRAIALFPEAGPENWLSTSEPAGVCSDYPAQYC